MDNVSIMRKDKLGFNGILRESFRVPISNPKFLVFSFLTSLPLFLSLLLFEFLFQEALVGSFRTLVSDDSLGSTHCINDGFCIKTVPSWGLMSSMSRVVVKHFHQFALLGLVYSVLVHPLDLLNTILILCHSSALYAGETLQSFSGFWRRPIKDFGFRGPLITSLYVFGLSALVTVGLISFGMQFYHIHPSWVESLILGNKYYSYYPSWDQVVGLLVFSLWFGGLFFALLVKYIDWSAVWNLGLAISVLEEKHGDIAIGVAAYISRGSRRRGFLLMLVFLLWRHCLRLLCLYLVWGKTWSRAGATVAQVLGVCSGNLMMWVVILVYYCDCKKRFLEKKIDLEEGKSTEHNK